MNLDKSKPYGEIWGHPWAKYEQGGVLFTSGGKPSSKHEVAETAPVRDYGTEAPASAEDAAAISAKYFLKKILREGPMNKAKLYKEVELNNQDWDAVKTAAAALNVRKYKQGSTELWKLTED